MTRALITASASGIGLAIARRLTADGASVMMSDLNESDGAARAAEIGADWHACDLRDADAITALVEAAGPLDILVNNGGVAGPTAPTQDIPVDVFKEVMDINITAQFVACKAALPAMIARRSGLIVNMSSVAGKIGLKNRAPYSASKWAVRGLTAVIAGEVGEYGIRVNAILPGSVRGERIERVIDGIASATGTSFDEAKKDLLNRQAIADFIEPEEIAAMVAYLASDAGRSITGQFLGIDGGYQ